MAERSLLVQDVPVAGHRLGQTRPGPPPSSFTACGTLDKPLTFSARQCPLQYKEKKKNNKSRSAQSAFRGAHADLAACGSPHFLVGCGHMPWRARLSPVRAKDQASRTVAVDFRRKGTGWQGCQTHRWVSITLQTVTRAPQACCPGRASQEPQGGAAGQAPPLPHIP